MDISIGHNNLSNIQDYSWLGYYHLTQNQSTTWLLVIDIVANNNLVLFVVLVGLL